MDRSENASRITSNDCEMPEASPATATVKPSDSLLTPEYMAWQARMNAGLKGYRAGSAFKSARETNVGKQQRPGFETNIAPWAHRRHGGRPTRDSSQERGALPAELLMADQIRFPARSGAFLVQGVGE